MDKIIYTFNQFFYDFVKDVRAASPQLKPDLKKHYKLVDRHCSDNISYFDGQMNDALFAKVCSLSVQELFKDEDLFAFQIFKGVTVKQVNDALELDTPFKSYFYILTLLNYIAKEVENSESLDGDQLYNNIIACLRKIQKKESYEQESKEILDDEIKSLLERLASVFSSKLDVEEAAAKDGLNFDSSMLENSTIGSLAKEIASELDISKLNVEKPEDLLNFTGDNNFLGNIVGKIGSKVNAKLESGELKHEDLLGEAMGLLKSLGGSGALGGIMNNPMFKEMLSGKAKVNEEKVRHSSARDRLRKKLEKRNA